VSDETLSVRELALRSRAAVHAGDKDSWLALFADDAYVQDPIGPSAFDPEGKGHHGKEAIGAFYDTVIASAEAISFDIQQSYMCGDEVADVGIIRTTLAGGTHQAVVHGVYTYKSNGVGKLAWLRAFWEMDALELVELPH
jgi:steroid delta-isomerase